MPRHPFVFPIALLSILLPACTFAPPAAAPPDIEAFAEEYAAAFITADPDRVAALLTDDFVAMAPEAPPLQGREAVARQIAGDMQRFRVRNLVFSPLESEVAGDWAWVRGSSRGDMVAAGVRHVLPLEGKFLWILRRGGDGRWRLARDASSASRPHTHDPARGTPPR